MSIPAEGLNEITSVIKALFSHGTYRIGTTTTEIAIESIELSGNEITVMLYLADDVSGTVNRFQLISYAGNILSERPDSVDKPTTKGLLVVFKFTISEVI